MKARAGIGFSLRVMSTDYFIFDSRELIVFLIRLSNLLQEYYIYLNPVTRQRLFVSSETLYAIRLLGSSFSLCLSPRAL
jgi:hypothetical protein